MASNLKAVAADVARMPWHRVRFPHTRALRTRLIASGAAPANASAKLSALRGVLKAAWRLGDRWTPTPTSAPPTCGTSLRRF